eukprot:scaffold293206_cov61-Attheya_sp.AAC.3
MICQTTVDSFDHAAYTKTKGEELSDFIRNWINEVIMHLANDDHEKFCALFCLTNPQVYRYLFRKPRLLTALPAQVAWNGNVKYFSTFHEQFKGHLCMRSLSYLFDTTFREYYLAKKITHAITCQAGYDAKLTFDQLSQDNSFLYGAIQQAIASSPTVFLFCLDSTSNDGSDYILVLSRNTSLEDQPLLHVRNSWHHKLMWHIPRIISVVLSSLWMIKVTAFHTLNDMDNTLFTTDQSKITGLHDSFQQSTDTWSYAQAISICTNYAKALDLLNNLIIIKEHSNQHAAHLSQTQNVHNGADYNDDVNVNHVNFRDVPPGLQLHQDLRNVLSRNKL